jgi:hypothetical protein
MNSRSVHVSDVEVEVVASEDEATPVAVARVRRDTGG